MADNEQPTLPAADKPKAGRPTKADLDAREAELNERAAALEAREAELNRAPRNPISEQSQRDTHGRDTKSTRRAMGATKRLDADIYIEKYGAEKQLMWINDLNGDVQRWINEGAEPVPVMNPTGKTYEGITDKQESKWVRAMGGSDGEGNYFWVYLLMMDHDVYDEVKLAPQRERQEMIRRAMKAGGDQSEYSEGPKLPSYAPNLPTGDVGLDTQHEVAR